MMTSSSMASSADTKRVKVEKTPILSCQDPLFSCYHLKSGGFLQALDWRISPSATYPNTTLTLPSPFLISPTWESQAEAKLLGNGCEENTKFQAIRWLSPEKNSEAES